MFHNIFKKIKKLRKKQKTPLIIADIHEKNSLILAELYKTGQITLNIKPLKIADYLIGDIAIERKTTSDLISSMINKRLIQQLNQIKIYKQPILIIEGDIQEIINEDNNISKAIRGLILSILINYQIPIIFSKDYKDSAKYLITLAKQQIKNKTAVSLHSRIPKTINERKKYVLESFPNIGPKKSEKLLKKFKTIKQTINATEEELEEILKSRVKEFKKILEG